MCIWPFCQLSDYSNARESEILANEDKLDIYEDRLGSYLVQISQHGVSMNDIRTVSRLLHAIGDFERIGDHALNLQESAQELHEKELHFSEPANEELQVLLAAMDEIMEKAFGSFQQDSAAMAVEVEPLEETIDRLTEEIRMQHIRRLQTGACTIQLGFVFNDLLTNQSNEEDSAMSVDFKDSETLKNLMRAFAGESQARNRYTFAASLCKKPEAPCFRSGFSSLQRDRKRSTPKSFTTI